MSVVNVLRTVSSIIDMEYILSNMDFVPD